MRLLAVLLGKGSDFLWKKKHNFWVPKRSNCWSNNINGRNKVIFRSRSRRWALSRWNAGLFLCQEKGLYADASENRRCSEIRKFRFPVIFQICLCKVNKSWVSTLFLIRNDVRGGECRGRGPCRVIEAQCVRCKWRISVSKKQHLLYLGARLYLLAIRACRRTAMRGSTNFCSREHIGGGKTLCCQRRRWCRRDPRPSSEALRSIPRAGRPLKLTIYHCPQPTATFLLQDRYRASVFHDIKRRLNAKM